MPIRNQPLSAAEAAERRTKTIQQLSGDVETASKPQVSKRLKDVPIRYRVMYLRAVTGIAAPRAAIKAFCLECVGWERAEVTRCTARACLLYTYRPYQE